MIHTGFRLTHAIPLVVAMLATGCSPQGGSGITEDVIEIEEIEMAPRPSVEPTEGPASTGGAAARQAVDAEKAAADEAIDAAAESIEPPPHEPVARSPEPPSQPDSPAADDPAAAESPQPEPPAEP